MAETAPFAELIDRRRDYTNFNIETTRGLVFDGLRLFALNTHASLVVVHTNLLPEPQNAWPTLNQPVAMDLWVKDGLKRLVVAGGGSHALMVHDANSGAVLGTVNLPSEPGDVVVHDDLSRAYVSCMGTNELVEVQLDSMVIARRTPIPSRRPRFLNLEGDTTNASAPFTVFVTPMASGNNTHVDATATQGSVVESLDDPLTGAVEGLPDEDLFAVDFSGAQVPVVRTVARGLGGIVTAHGRNPASESDEYWVLSLVPDNANPAKQSEPDLQQDFISNVITLLPDTLGNYHPLPDALGIVDLDQRGASDPKPCSFPVALAFDSDGTAVVAGSTSDRISYYTKTGAYLGHSDLDAGSIPRDV